MRRGLSVPARIVVALILAASCIALFSGCEDKAHYDDVEKKALQYYQGKYGVKGVSITNSYKAGNSGLFGYAGVKDRAYELSDGNAIFWDDDSAVFADNAQASEIISAFEREILDPLISQISFPMKHTALNLNRTDMESFDECVFTAYFTGDIRKFAMEESPRLSDFTLAIETTETEACEKEISQLYDALKPSVSGFGDAYILSDGLGGLDESTLYINDRSLNVKTHAHMDFKGSISWYRQNYIEIGEGISITSAKKDFDFKDGDVVLEQIGSCADVQQQIDDGYYAMPVDAPENKDGGYMVHDRRHENHVVIDDQNAPAYRLALSDRVRQALDENGRLSVYFLSSRADGLPFMVYYGKKGNASYSVYKVCDNDVDYGEYDTISPDNLYYFGTHTSYAFEE